MWYETISNRKNPLKKQLFMRDIRLRYGAFRSSRFLHSVGFVVFYRNFGKSYRAPLNLGPISCFETVVKENQHTFHIILEEQKPHPTSLSRMFIAIDDGSKRGEKRPES